MSGAHDDTTHAIYRVEVVRANHKGAGVIAFITVVFLTVGAFVLGGLILGKPGSAIQWWAGLSVLGFAFTFGVLTWGVLKFERAKEDFSKVVSSLEQAQHANVETLLAAIRDNGGATEGGIKELTSAVAALIQLQNRPGTIRTIHGGGEERGRR